MNKLGFANAVLDVVVSAGAGAVVGNAIKASTPANSNLLRKVTIGVGGLALSGAAGGFASEYVQKQVAQTVEQFHALKNATLKKN